MSIANYLTALDAQRDQLARNLVTMGVQASESEKLNTLVPKVLQIPSGRPEVTLFCNGNDALTTYGESIYTFYIDGYRSIAGFADVYPHFCCAENDYAIYYNQPDFNWGAVIYTMHGSEKRYTAPPIHKAFELAGAETHFDDPAEQAEYIYSLIEVKT